MKNFLSLSLTLLFLLCGCSSDSSDETSTNDTTEPTTEICTETETTSTVTTTIRTTTSTTETTTIPSATEAVTVPAIIPDDGQLVRVLDYIPDAVIDMRYATTNNFTGVVLYDDPEAYLCYGTVKKLIKVQEELKEKGFRILIWDAYRSPEAQWNLWEAYPDPTYVADPRNGLTSHSRGNTIDIAIVYEDGSPVELPSEFDEFSTVADRNYGDVSEEARTNAMMLESVMYENGFTGYSGEWWDFSDTETYTLKDISATTSGGDEQINILLTENNYTLADISEAGQLIIVDSYGAACDVYCYEKSDDYWSCSFESSGIIGMNGATANKREGDKCTPLGLYSLGFAFGTESVDTDIEYRLLNENCYWVDDTQSEYYNQWVETSSPSWSSAEHLIDYTKSYKYAVTINYNTDPVIKGAGSAIFLHCASGNYTAGCVAVPENDMYKILSWLDEAQTPMILIL